MKILPSASIVYHTSLQPSEVRNRLHQNTEPEKFFRISLRREYKKAYQGTITEEGFKLQRLLDYKNSFAPVIVGKIFGEEEGTRIEVKLRLHAMVRIFCLIWISGVSTGFVAAVVTSIHDREILPFALIPLAMLGFILLLCHGAFSGECQTAQNDLDKMFDHKAPEYH